MKSRQGDGKIIHGDDVRGLKGEKKDPRMIPFPRAPITNSD